MRILERTLKRLAEIIIGDKGHSSLKAWIENGDSLMPPFKDVIDDNQIKGVIAYVKTL